MDGGGVGVVDVVDGCGVVDKLLAPDGVDDTDRALDVEDDKRSRITVPTGIVKVDVDVPLLQQLSPQQ